jgi:hypothetical protein
MRRMLSKASLFTTNYEVRLSEKDISYIEDGFRTLEVRK